MVLKMTNGNTQYKNYIRDGESTGIDDDRIELPDDIIDLVKTYQSEQFKIAIPYDKRSK